MKDNCKKCGLDLSFSARQLDTGFCHACAHKVLASIQLAMNCIITTQDGTVAQLSDAVEKYKVSLEELLS